MIKKTHVIILSVVLVILTAFVSIGLVNPFGFFSLGELLKMKIASNVINSYYYEEFNPALLAEGALAGMVDSLGDPYTIYMDQEITKAFNEQISSTYAGIGAQIERTADDNYVTVVSAFEGSPAERAGLKTGDKILKADDTLLFADKLTEASKTLQGPQGTSVVITVLKKDTLEPIEITIVREKITLETVSSKMIDGEIGYISLSSFSNNTAQEFSDHLDELKNQQMKKLIIDVRGNPGGRVDVCTDIADELLPDGVIVYTLDKNDIKNEYRSNESELGIPMTVLIDGGSASASEILAGAIRDFDKGTLIGETSYGKGLVQTVRPLGDGSEVKVTISRYYTPSGVCIDNEGIVPDIEVAPDFPDIPLSKLTDEEDNQLKKAIEHLKTETE